AVKPSSCASHRGRAARLSVGRGRWSKSLLVGGPLTKLISHAESTVMNTGPGGAEEGEVSRPAGTRDWLAKLRSASMSGMRIFVAGASGVLGRSVVPRLV